MALWVNVSTFWRIGSGECWFKPRSRHLYSFGPAKRSRKRRDEKWTHLNSLEKKLLDGGLNLGPSKHNQKRIQML